MNKSCCNSFAIRILTALILASTSAYAQKYDPNHPPNTFSSVENPLYWKNKLPHPGYWQQDVSYKIDATINDKTDIIDGKEKLVYTNNSPDTLRFVFFHLYQNAFQPESFAAELYEQNNYHNEFGKYEKQKLGTSIEQLSSDGILLKTELENTVLKVYLNTPLAPGNKVEFNIDFKTYFDSGSIRRRMKLYRAGNYKHYNGVHWYPRICVYDRKFGWSTDQHLGKEFYGNFGTFEVNLSFPNHYVVDATGTLQNSDEVMPDSLRKKLDLKNFIDNPWNSRASEIIIPDGTYKTWSYYAENIHDFAFTADPSYRIDEAEWNGIKVIALVQEGHASGWKNAAEYGAKILKVYSENVGMYEWPRVILADAQDGMEYTMLTLDGERDPDYRDLFAHEIGHQWFYGMVASNETYRATLDEGFAQFINVMALDSIDGPYPVKNKSASAYHNRYRIPTTNLYNRNYYSYMRDAILHKDVTVNRHSDHFNGGVRHEGGYNLVYYKPAVMLHNLRYVLGDSLFSAAFKNYFNQWKFAHPYEEDFRNSIIQFTGVDLNWFFDQFMDTNEHIDYAIKRIKKLRDDNYQVIIKRKGEMQMPIDLTVYSKDGTVNNYYIPNTWFEKQTEATTLKRWIGWDNIHQTYTANVIAPGGIERVVIDTTQKLADINMRNNVRPYPINWSFDSQVINYPDWTSYELKGRPDLWWNSYDGVKAGFHINGNFMRQIDAMSLSMWFNTGLAQGKAENFRDFNGYDDISFIYKYQTTLHKWIPESVVKFMIKDIDGLRAGKIGFEKGFKKEKYKFLTEIKSLNRKSLRDLDYLLYPADWDPGKFNTSILFSLTDNYKYRKGNGKIILGLKSSVFSSQYDYTYLNLEVINQVNVKKLEFRTRTFAQYAFGNRFAKESSLYLAGSSPEEMMENKFIRSRGMVPDEWIGNYGADVNHFQHGGGLNLRGYAGYLAPQTDEEGTQHFTYRGQSGAAINAEMDFDKFIHVRPKYTRNWLKIDSYLFADAGIINYDQGNEKLRLSDLRMDAGLGLALTIKKWGPLQSLKPLTFRFDMPLFLSNAPAKAPDNIAFRWLVGINRSF